MEASLTLLPGRLHLLIAPRAAGYQLLNACVAHLASTGPVDVIDGGNGFDVHAIARSLRAHTSAVEMALQRIRIARAFTCYQVVALLAQYFPVQRPLLVMDLLATFSDDNVPLAERMRLLEQISQRLLSLSRPGPLAVSLSPSANENCLNYLETALDSRVGSALTIWRIEAPAEQLPLRFF